MPNLRLRLKGDFSKTEKWLENLKRLRVRHILEKYGQKGVDALASATPVDTGLTASSWSYEILEYKTAGWQLVWKNSNVNKGVNIALILQYGHGTGTGGYVQGIDYINPALRPIFEEISNKIGEEIVANG